MWITRRMRWSGVGLLGSGFLLQSSCTTDLQDSAISGLTSFVATSVNAILTSLFLTPLGLA